MFIRKSAFENLVKRCDSQQKQIENLNEKLGILAQSLGHEFEFQLVKFWDFSGIRPEHNKFNKSREETLSSDWSF